MPVAPYPPQGRPIILPDPLPINAPHGQVLIVYNGGIRGLTAGPISNILASGGPSHPPTWMPVPGPMEIFYPASVLTQFSVDSGIADRELGLSADGAGIPVIAFADAPADGIRRFDAPVVASVVSDTLVPNHIFNALVGVGSVVELTVAVTPV